MEKSQQQINVCRLWPYNTLRVTVIRDMMISKITVTIAATIALLLAINTFGIKAVPGATTNQLLAIIVILNVV